MGAGERYLLQYGFCRPWRKTMLKFQVTKLLIFCIQLMSTQNKVKFSFTIWQLTTCLHFCKIKCCSGALYAAAIPTIAAAAAAAGRGGPQHASPIC
jgi:hypothetical protein